MVQLQRTFKESYVKALRDAVKSGEAVPKYSAESFEIDESQVKRLANVYEPTGLAEKMEAACDNDFKAAVAVYEAYKDISPLLASSESFWAYLTHTTLFKYTQNRWPKVKNNSASTVYILSHWFIGGKGILRNAIASLWWGMHLTVDEEREDKYELSRILFSNFNMRIVNLGSSLLIRHREAMIGILEFMRDNPDVMLDPRLIFIAKYFNRLGSSRQLAYLDRHFFYDKLLSMKDRIMLIDTREDTSVNELYNDNN